jgi:allophanate hydrolase subunit 2
LAGDQLDLGAPVRPHGSLVDVGRGASPGSPREVRVLAGPHHAADRAWRQLLEDRWTVGGASNRIGVRLVGAGGPLHYEAIFSDLSVTASTGFASTGVITGAIQLPPDGRPIILLPDHATVGGYPVIGCVIAADLAAVGQLAPGDLLTFTEVGLAAARRAWQERVRVLNGRVHGWFPTAAGT